MDKSTHIIITVRDVKENVDVRVQCFKHDFEAELNKFRVKV
jgi:hypothetical protein